MYYGDVSDDEFGEENVFEGTGVRRRVAGVEVFNEGVKEGVETGCDVVEDVFCFFERVALGASAGLVAVVSLVYLW